MYCGSWAIYTGPGCGGGVGGDSIFFFCLLVFVAVNSFRSTGTLLQAHARVKKQTLRSPIFLFCGFLWTACSGIELKMAACIHSWSLIGDDGS